MKVKGFYEFRSEFMESNIFFVIKCRNGIFEFFQYIFVTVDGHWCIVNIHNFLHLLDFFSYCSKQGTHFRILAEYTF